MKTGIAPQLLEAAGSQYVAAMLDVLNDQHAADEERASREEMRARLRSSGYGRG